MSNIPSEFTVGGIYLPPLLVAGCLGVLLAYWTVAPAESLPAIAAFLLSAPGFRSLRTALHRRCRVSVRYRFDQEEPLAMKSERKYILTGAIRSSGGRSRPAQVLGPISPTPGPATGRCRRT